PVTKSPVNRLSADKMGRLNALIENGEVHYVDGSTVETPLQEGLITESGKMIYRVDDGIPVMLAEQGINTDQLADGVI
ncbi:MAG: Trm112 family protein, partial [Gammaproteobacteria bacterium]